MRPALTRRPERPADAAFRFDLFRDTRPPGQDLAGLDAPLRDILLRQSFDGQTATYAANHPAARHEIVETDGVPVGRMVVDAAAKAVTLVDIALAVDTRGQGLGTRLVRELLAEAGTRPVHLCVAAGNAAALRLYQRLGFEIVAADAVETKMVAVSPSAARGRRWLDTVGSDEGGFEWRRDPSSVTAPPQHLLPQASEEKSGGCDLYPDRLCLPLVFDPAPLAADLAGLATPDWTRHFVTQNYDGDWSVIPLRGKAGATHPVMMIYADPACQDFEDTPFLAACPAIRAVLEAFACPLDAVRLMRLGPVSIIKTHVDVDLDVTQGAVRFHVPIVTNPEVEFLLNGIRVTMAAGSAWYLRLSDPHSVANRGTSDRVHLVIDARVTPWVEALLHKAMAGLMDLGAIDRAGTPAR